MKKQKFNPSTVRHNSTKIISKLAFLTFLLLHFAIYDVKAQGCDPFIPMEDQPGCEDNNPDDVPIDGGASVLIAAGVAYGLKKVYDKRKQNKGTDVA